MLFTPVYRPLSLPELRREAPETVRAELRELRRNADRFAAVGAIALSLGILLFLATFFGGDFAFSSGVLGAGALQFIYWLSFLIAGVGQAALSLQRGQSPLWGLCAPLTGLFHRLLFGFYHFHPLYGLILLPYLLLPTLLQNRRARRIAVLERFLNGTITPRPTNSNALTCAFGLAPLTLTSPFALWYAVLAVWSAARRNRSLWVPTAAVLWASCWVLAPIVVVLYYRAQPSATVNASDPYSIHKRISADGVTVDLLPGWGESQELKQIAGYLLTASQPVKDIGLGIVSIRKSDLKVSSPAEVALTLARQTQGLRETGEPRSIVLGGRTGSRLVYRFEADGYLIVMDMTVLETTDRFLRINLWTLDSNYEQHRSEFDQTLAGVSVAD